MRRQLTSINNLLVPLMKISIFFILKNKTSTRPVVQTHEATARPMLLAAEHVSKWHASRKPTIGRWALSRGSELLGQFIDDHFHFRVVVVFGDVFGILTDVLKGLHHLLVLKLAEQCLVEPQY